MIEWRFPSNNYGETKGINDSGVALFKGTPLKSIAREICQNSLDAGIKETVVVDFELFKIPTSKIPGHDYLKDVFERCLEFWSQQKAQTTRDFYENALEIINKEYCYVLRISDFNTSGLTGSREEMNTNWTNLTKSSGSSDKEGIAGGSFGIGKFATFACSDFSTVFYSTLDENGEEAFQGVSRLVTFKDKSGDTTQGIGYYGNSKNTPVYEQLLFEQRFKRDSNDSGTDIYVVGYRYAGQKWETDIVVSVLEGFLGAIWKNKLIVNVGGTRISNDTLQEVLEIYQDDLVRYTDRYYEVLTSEKTEWVESNIMGLGMVKLGLMIGNTDAPKRVAMIRSTGMKIMDKDRLGHVPVVGVMFIEGEKLNNRLRLIENPEHTKWEPERARNPHREKELLRAMNQFIGDTIEKLVSKSNKNEIDAIGVGSFLPDEEMDSESTTTEDVVSDKIVEIEKNISKKRAISGKNTGESDLKEPTVNNGYKEPYGEDEEWFHNDGKTDEKKERDSQSAHTEEGGEDAGAKKYRRVSLEKFVSICVEKNKGKYVFMLIPDATGKEGVLEVYLSAETQNYEAPIIKANLIGGKEVSIEGNKIKGLNFEKGESIRLSVELDFNDYCSVEVKTYAIEE